MQIVEPFAFCIVGELCTAAAYSILFRHCGRTYFMRDELNATLKPATKHNLTMSIVRRSRWDLPTFVVHEHWASSHHFDFRLEMEGVLKSWAVPRGPLLTPGTKRLGIQVDDHTIEYGSFEGTIPEGEYGAGKVKIWDRGEYVLLEKSPDAMKIDLQGKKLTGNYALVFFRRNAASAAAFQTSQAEPQSLLVRVVS